MPFKEYPKIKRLGEEENDGILIGTVFVQEKIDGANTSIWLDENGEIQCGSRTQRLSSGFNGFVDYVKAHEGIKKLLTDHPTFRLYGEWLVRHTIAYDETVYKQFYLFDICTIGEDGEHRDWSDTDSVEAIAQEYGINFATILAKLEYPTLDQIMPFVGTTKLGSSPKGEGVVLKNPAYINKFGSRVCAKIVTQEFKEDNGIVFGGNSKHSETYVEMKMVNKFMTMARIQKIMNKIQPTIDKRLGRENTAQIINTAYYDMFTEELWGFVKDYKLINFAKLQGLACKKAARIYHDVLDGHISVAYENSDNSEGATS